VSLRDESLNLHVLLSLGRFITTNDLFDYMHSNVLYHILVMMLLQSLHNEVNISSLEYVHFEISVDLV
jgi:hypothetical protein